MYVIIAIVIILLALGITHFVRRQISASRAELKHVDRSKLRDLDQDAWADAEHDSERDQRNDKP